MMLSTYAKQLIRRVVLSREGDITPEDMEHLQEEIFSTVNKMLKEEYRHTSELWRKRLGPVGPPYFSVNHKIVANEKTVGKYTLTHIDVTLTIDGIGSKRINLSSHVDEDIFNWVVASLKKLKLLERMQELAGEPINEGTWSYPKTPEDFRKAEQVIKNLRAAKTSAYKVLGNDSLLDHIENAIDIAVELKKYGESQRKS